MVVVAAVVVVETPDGDNPLKFHGFARPQSTTILASQGGVSGNQRLQELHANSLISPFFRCGFLSSLVCLHRTDQVFYFMCLFRK